MRPYLIVRQHWLLHCSFDDAVLPQSDNNGYDIAHLMMRPYLRVRQHWLWHCSFDDAVLTSECDNNGYGIAHLMMRSYLRVWQHWLWHCSFDDAVLPHSATTLVMTLLIWWCGLTSECDNIGYDIAHLMMRSYLIVDNNGYGIAHLMKRPYLIVRQHWLWHCSFDDAALPHSATTLVMTLLIWWCGLIPECDNIGYDIAHLMMRPYLIVRQHWLWHCSFDDAVLPQSATTLVMALLIWWCGLTS